MTFSIVACCSRTGMFGVAVSSSSPAVAARCAYAQAGAVEDMPVEALRRQFEANFFGWHDLTRRVVAVMRRQGHGRIVHCSSILGMMPLPYRGACCASKYALEGLMLSLRQELDGSGIHVSLIEPGPVASSLYDNGFSVFSGAIDSERSFHRRSYERELEQVRSGRGRKRAGPDVVYKALRNGSYYPWDFQPLRQASERYMRNHMNLDNLEEQKRFPRGE